MQTTAARRVATDQDLDRGQALGKLQADKMARSPHAFVRGNTVDHYRWLARP